MVVSTRSSSNSIPAGRGRINVVSEPLDPLMESSRDRGSSSREVRPGSQEGDRQTLDEDRLRLRSLEGTVLELSNKLEKFMENLSRGGGRPEENSRTSSMEVHNGSSARTANQQNQQGPREQDTSPGHTLPPPCTLLSVGRAFAGTQNVSSMQKDEAWMVNVRIQGCDLDYGYLCGTMEALNVPLADTPVVTFWEGEIVDTKNYTFYTGKWEATPEDDIRHWSKFPSFDSLLSQVEADGGKSMDLSNYPFIFMRWKEQYFVNVGIDCGLTIAGFYYVCFSCSDGSINGFYYDPNSSPFQKLELKSTNEGRSGFSFSSYQLQ